MEELNKTQVVLLTLLVSFVTSIATGIVTVTLMDQAPAGVTQTINRVVERTVERIVPGETQIATVIKEVPVQVSNDELAVKAIASAREALVRIEGVGVGFVISEDGLAVADGQLIKGVATGTRYTAKNATGPLEGELRAFDKERNIAVFSFATTTPFIPLAGKSLSVGQTVILVGVASDVLAPKISMGIVTSLEARNASSSPEILTNIGDYAGEPMIGGPLMNLASEAAAINLGLPHMVQAQDIDTLIKSL